MPSRLIILALLLCLAGFWIGAALAQARDEFPFSIMREEPGSRASRRPVSRPKQVVPAAKDSASEQAPRQARKSGPRQVRRGSSSYSNIPVYQSPVTPLGTAPRVGNVQRLGQPASPSVIVPGIQSNTGPAMTPPRPAGQNFQDRAINCVHSGSASGVGPGQIGSFTQNCVNR